MAVGEEARAVLWHRRMAHLSYSGLAKMADSKMVQGLPVPGADFRAAAQRSCNVCARSKQPRGPHKEFSPPCALRVLSALHADLLEMRVPSSARYRYVLGGVHSHSRFCFARQLKTKVEADAAQEESIAILQRQNADGRMLQELRTDMGAEFLSGGVESYYKKNGVLHGKTAGYSSQSKGLGERCWWTTMDRTRAALKECRLQRGYWWDAMRHCIDIMNRSPHANGSRTPFEVFTGKLPSVERLKVFGCRAYASILSPLRDGKLGDRAQHAVYQGRDTDSAADLFLLDNGSVRGFRHVSMSRSFLGGEVHGVTWTRISVLSGGG